jgi:hypothetical protein
MEALGFIFDDGGRETAGFKGKTGDCVTRSIAIVTGKPYKEVYDALFNEQEDLSTGRSRVARAVRRKGASPRDGVHRKAYDKYLRSIGMKWIPCMSIGTGCKVHLRKDELPSGKLIVRVSKHLTAVIDGVIHDTFNPSRDIHCTRPNDGSPLKQTEWLHPDGDVICSIQSRCVYGYYIKL